MLQHSQSSTVVKEPININIMTDEYLRLDYNGLRAKDKSFNVKIKPEFDETTSNINIILQEIGRVLLNVYNISFYAVNEKYKQQRDGYEPTITISTKKIGDKVEIRVKDMAMAFLKKFWTKFFNLFSLPNLLE